ncbi:MAG: hypothetical protein ACN4GM_15830 [Gammaproteobacteria bacterium]
MKKISSVFSIIMFLMALSMTVNQASAADWLVGAGLTIGGDELGGTSVDTVDAGELIRVYGGVQLPVGDSPLKVQLTMGYHFDSVESEQGTGSFDRLEFELIPYYYLDKFRLGLGVTQHVSVAFDQPTGFPDYDFDDATGIVFEVAHVLGRHERAWLHLRLVDIE